MAKRPPSPVPGSSHQDQHIRKYTRSPSPTGPVRPSLATPPTHPCPSPDCIVVFPTAHFLDLHLSERHDPLIASRQARGEKTFRCFEPGCDKVTIDPAKRRRHLIDKHGYPRDFEFRVVVEGTRGLKSWLRHGPGGTVGSKRGRGRGRGTGAGRGRSKEHIGRGGGGGAGRGQGRGGTLTLPVRTAPRESGSDKPDSRLAKESTVNEKKGTAAGLRAETKDSKASSSDDESSEEEEEDEADEDDDADHDSADDESDDDDDNDNGSDEDSDEDSDDDEEEEEQKTKAQPPAKTRPKSPDIDALAQRMATTLRFVPRSVVGRRPLQEKEKTKK